MKVSLLSAMMIWLHSHEPYWSMIAPSFFTPSRAESAMERMTSARLYSPIPVSTTGSRALMPVFIDVLSVAETETPRSLIPASE